MAFAISSDDFAVKLCEMLGVEYDNTSRIIIDLKPCEPVMVYIGLVATNELLSLDWPTLDASQVVRLDRMG